jgi:hypothetical protein
MRRNSKSIERLSRFAETSFASLCAAAGALCNESQEDENGWDYLVEFPADVAIGPADTHPPAKRAFVQIKSTRTNRPTCSIKLSNALRAAQSRDPWFVILTVETRARPKIYAVHIWEPLIERILKAVRQATIEKVPLHRRRLVINFTESDAHTDDLVDWMRDTIKSVTPEYSEAKKRIYETVGYSGGHGAGTLTFAVDNVEQIFDEFLGLGKGLPISRFTYTPARFGLSDSQPQIDATEGRVEITPTAAGDCELRMRGTQSGSIIGVPAKIFTLGMPWLSIEEQRFRVAAAGFEIVWANDGGSKFTANLDFQACVDLDSIRRFATITVWLGEGPVDVQIWTKGRRIAGGFLNADPGQRTYDWQKVLDVVNTLRALNAEAPPLCVSLNDIDAGARDLYLMHEVVSAPSIRLDFLPLPDVPNDFGAVLYYSTAQVRNLTVHALVERRVRRAINIEDGRRRIDFDRPIIRESWIVADASDTQRTLINDDYQHHLSQMQNNSKVLELGDIALFVRSLQKLNSQPSVSDP